MDRSKQAPSPAAGRGPAREPAAARRQTAVACLGIALTLVLSASSQTVPYAGVGVVEDDPGSSLFATLSTFSTALCLVGAGLLVLRRPRAGRALAPLAAGCALLSLALWLVGTRGGQQLLEPASPLLAGSACSWGVGVGAACLFWIPSLRALTSRQAGVAAALATCLSGPLEAAVFSISHPWGHCAALAALIAASAGLAARVPRPEPAAPCPEPAPRALAQVVRPIGGAVSLVAITGFASGALRALARPQDSRLHLLVLLLCALAAGALCMLCARRSERWLDTQAARVGMLAAVSTVFVAFPLTRGTVAVLLEAAADLCYLAGSAYVMVLCTRRERGARQEASCAVGLAFGCVYLLTGLGFALNKGLLMAFGSSSTSSLILSVVALYLMVIACILALARKAFPRGRASGDGAAPALVLDVVSEADIRSNEALRTRYRISEREMDVVVLMMGGESVAAMGKALQLSENTVKSHIKKIYSKLGVHTKDEFRQLVRAVTASPRGGPSAP